MLKRDYELTEQQFERRNKHREIGKYKTKRTNPHGLLIWYDGKLNNITTEEYRKIIAREYTIQKDVLLEDTLQENSHQNIFYSILI